MHPAGILHFASPDIMSVLVITRKNTRETLQNQFSPSMSVLVKKKKQEKKTSQILLSSSDSCARCTRIPFHSQGCHKCASWAYEACHLVGGQQGRSACFSNAK